MEKAIKSIKAEDDLSKILAIEVDDDLSKNFDKNEAEIEPEEECVNKHLKWNHIAVIVISFPAFLIYSGYVADYTYPHMYQTASFSLVPFLISSYVSPVGIFLALVGSIMSFIKSNYKKSIKRIMIGSVILTSLGFITTSVAVIGMIVGPTDDCEMHNCNGMHASKLPDGYISPYFGKYLAFAIIQAIILSLVLRSAIKIK